jgi:hypothetical protein
MGKYKTERQLQSCLDEEQFSVACKDHRFAKVACWSDYWDFVNLVVLNIFFRASTESDVVWRVWQFFLKREVFGKVGDVYGAKNVVKFLEGQLVRSGTH